jgi:hypothetical protein
MIHVLALAVFVFGVILAAYTGGWLLFIKPIMDACKAFDSGSLTALTVGVTVIKCVVAGTVASLIVYISSLIAALLNK